METQLKVEKRRKSTDEVCRYCQVLREKSSDDESESATQKLDEAESPYPLTDKSEISEIFCNGESKEVTRERFETSETTGFSESFGSSFKCHLCLDIFDAVAKDLCRIWKEQLFPNFVDPARDIHFIVCVPAETRSHFNDLKSGRPVFANGIDVMGIVRRYMYHSFQVAGQDGKQLDLCSTNDLPWIYKVSFENSKVVLTLNLTPETPELEPPKKRRRSEAPKYDWNRLQKEGFQWRITVDCRCAPLLLFGKYCKYCRNLFRPTGGRAEEELLLEALRPAFLCEHVRFMGYGREEDLDVRMLGKGRGFMLEVVGAKNLPTLTELHSLLEPMGIQHMLRFTLTRILSLSFSKSTKQIKIFNLENRKEKLKIYGAVIKASRSLAPGIVESVMRTFGSETPQSIKHIAQQTPIRFLHRRPLITRNNKIHDIQLHQLRDQVLAARLVTCQRVRSWRQGQDNTIVGEFVSASARSKRNTVWSK